MEKNFLIFLMMHSPGCGRMIRTGHKAFFYLIRLSGDPVRTSEMKTPYTPWASCFSIYGTAGLLHLLHPLQG